MLTKKQREAQARNLAARKRLKPRRGGPRVPDLFNYKCYAAADGDALLALLIAVENLHLIGR